VVPRADLDDVEERGFFALLEIGLQPLGLASNYTLLQSELASKMVVKYEKGFKKFSLWNMKNGIMRK
jgi:hypothetical protein